MESEFKLKCVSLLRRYMMLTGWFVGWFLSLRVFEYLIVNQMHVLPSNAFRLYIFGGFADILLAVSLGLLLGIAFFGVGLLNQKIADWIVIGAHELVILGYLSLIFYFSYSLTPLGANVFGYSFAELGETVLTSAHISWWMLSVVPILMIGYALGAMRLGAVSWSLASLYVALIALLLSGSISLVLLPSQSNFDKDTEYHLAVNKLQYFLDAAIEYQLRPERGDVELEPKKRKNNKAPKRDNKSKGEFSGKDWTNGLTVDGQRYPLLREADYTDVLSPYLRKTDNNKPPNFVFIVLEGVGGSFTGPFAQYGGFMPFLDSLASKSLYWTHFFSTSGRTFGLHPALYGSLPYGESGFMEKIFRAPRHQTLISILNENDYKTTYLAGADTTFDNVKHFLKKQNIDRIIDRNDFGDEYELKGKNNSGFSWGYSDRKLVKRASEYLSKQSNNGPRLDMYLTLSLHAPFKVEQQQKYLDEVSKIVSEKDVSKDWKEFYSKYKQIFATFLYTDDVLQRLISIYRKRDDFDRTIFIITGDHRIAPIPHKNQVDRFYVPFMIFSPLLKKKTQIHSVSSHLDVAPSLMSHLVSNYRIKAPDKVHWLGDKLDTQKKFRSVKHLPLMRNPHQMVDYLYGRNFLSNDSLYRLTKGMGLQSIQDRKLKKKVAKEFENFKRANQYVMSKNRLLPKGHASSRKQDPAVQKENEVLQKYDLHGKEDLKIFRKAQKLAWDGKYRDSKVLLRRVLRISPSFVDAKVMKARIEAWNDNYGKAVDVLLKATESDPGYYDIYRTLGDIYFWKSEPKNSIKYLKTGLDHNPDNPDLLYPLARAYFQKGDMEKAKKILKKALDIEPNHQKAEKLKGWILE